MFWCIETWVLNDLHKYQSYKLGMVKGGQKDKNKSLEYSETCKSLEYSETCKSLEYSETCKSLEYSETCCD